MCIFSKFDATNYSDHGHDANHARFYFCPKCDTKLSQPDDILVHVHKKRSQEPCDSSHHSCQGKELHTFRIAMRTDGEPDYYPTTKWDEAGTRISSTQGVDGAASSEPLAKRVSQQPDPYRPGDVLKKAGKGGTGQSATVKALREAQEAFVTHMQLVQDEAAKNREEAQKYRADEAAKRKEEEEKIRHERAEERKLWAASLEIQREQLGLSKQQLELQTRQMQQQTAKDEIVMELVRSTRPGIGSGSSPPGRDSHFSDITQAAARQQVEAKTNC